MGGPGMGRGGFGFGVTSLLRTELVQAELGVDKATVEKADEAVRALREQQMASGGGFANLRDLPEDERRAKMDEMRAKMQEFQKEQEKKIAEIIGMEKFGRLKEIELQMAGVSAMGRSEVADYLGLSQEQKDKIGQIMDANRGKAMEKMRSLFTGDFRQMSEEERAAAREKMQAAQAELQKELETEVMAVLTDEQKTKLGQMMGEPFAKMEELRQQVRESFGRGGFGGDRGPRGERGQRGDRGNRGNRGEDRPQRPT